MHLHNTTGIPLLEFEAADLFTTFGTVDAHIHSTFAEFQAGKGGGADVDVTYEQAVEMATRYPFDRLVTDADAFKWQQTMQVEHNTNNKHAHAVQLYSFTHLRALLGLHDRSLLSTAHVVRWGVNEYFCETLNNNSNNIQHAN
jgi:DNA repair protein RadC